jgi:hypothetical protein
VPGNLIDELGKLLFRHAGHYSPLAVPCSQTYRRALPSKATAIRQAKKSPLCESGRQSARNLGSNVKHRLRAGC